MTTPLVARDVLAALAHLQPAPCLTWSSTADLRLEHVCGPLASLIDPNASGQHWYDILGTDSLEHPILGAIHKALQGERICYTVFRYGHWWDSCVVPVRHMGFVAGVIGTSILKTELPQDGVEPCRFSVVAPDEEARVSVGDKVVVFPAEQRASAVHPLGTEAVGRLMVEGKIRPMPAYTGVGVMPVSGAVGPLDGAGPRAPRLLRGRLRLEG